MLVKPDLSMTSDSNVCADVQRALDAIKTGTSTPGFTLDVDVDAQLAPFMAMFQFERIKSPYGVAHALLLLYAPFGVAFMVLRIVFGFAIALVLPRVLTETQLDRSGLHVLFALLTGTIVTIKNAHLFNKDAADVIVANHISEFDAIALKRLTPAYVLGYDFYKKLLFFRLLGDTAGLVYVPYVSRNQGGAEGRDDVREIIVEKLAKKDKPLAAFPEVRLVREYRFVHEQLSSDQDMILSPIRDDLCAVSRADSRTAAWGSCSTTSFSSRLERRSSRSRFKLQTARSYVYNGGSHVWLVLLMR